MARVAAGAFGFLIFSHAFDGPDLYGESSFFETMPKPSLQMALNISTPSPWPSTLNANYLQVWTSIQTSGPEPSGPNYFRWDITLIAAHVRREDVKKYGPLSRIIA
jgi:hypothetical protein